MMSCTNPKSLNGFLLWVMEGDAIESNGFLLWVMEGDAIESNGFLLWVWKVMQLSRTDFFCGYGR